MILLAGFFITLGPAGKGVKKISDTGYWKKINVRVMKYNLFMIKHNAVELMHSIH
jgi:hypothetical protein